MRLSSFVASVGALPCVAAWPFNCKWCLVNILGSRYNWVIVLLEELHVYVSRKSA